MIGEILSDRREMEVWGEMRERDRSVTERDRECEGEIVTETEI